MNLIETSTFTMTRTGRFLSARLKGPHLTLTTSQVNGGERADLAHLLNHQSCEGKGHMGLHHDLAVTSREDYHKAVCAEASLPPATTALLGTAANMQNAALATRTFEEISVHACVTAGVQGNAGRAGDEARWHEGAEAWKPVHALGGTINTLLIFDWPLLPAALTRAVATMTEAKSAVLQELAVSSRYSPYLATGTGTDQFALAAPIDAARKPKTWTGKHSKLGEILAQAVMDATREALLWQNGLEPSRTRNLVHALGRYGITEDTLKEAMRARLEPKDATLLADNFLGVLHEPQVAAAAYALAAVMERAAFAVLPPDAASESLVNQAALLAASLAQKPDAFPRFRAALVREAGAEARAAVSAPRPDLLPLVSRALALGWFAKWE